MPAGAGLGRVVRNSLFLDLALNFHLVGHRAWGAEPGRITAQVITDRPAGVPTESESRLRLGAHAACHGRAGEPRDDT